MKKLFKLLLVLLLLALLALLALLGGSWYMQFHTKDMVAGTMEGAAYSREISLEAMTQDADLDVILVLGCGLSADGGPSPMLRDRLALAVFLYEEGYADLLLLSGDNGTVEYNEVQAMRDYVEEQGVPDEAVVCDYAGFSTYDSLYRAQNIFGVQRLLVVTQGYHLPRALYIGDALGMEIYGAAADQEKYSGQFLRDLREVLARDKDFLKCIRKPEASIMGDPIKIK